MPIAVTSAFSLGWKAFVLFLYHIDILVNDLPMQLKEPLTTTTIVCEN
jgi:hypothetical protein